MPLIFRIWEYVPAEGNTFETIEMRA
jgi:hypothetical protein